MDRLFGRKLQAFAMLMRQHDGGQAGKRRVSSDFFPSVFFFSVAAFFFVFLHFYFLFLFSPALLALLLFCNISPHVPTQPHQDLELGMDYEDVKAAVGDEPRFLALGDTDAYVALLLLLPLFFSFSLSLSRPRPALANRPSTLLPFPFPSNSERQKAYASWSAQEHKQALSDFQDLLTEVKCVSSAAAGLFSRRVPIFRPHVITYKPSPLPQVH